MTDLLFNVGLTYFLLGTLFLVLTVVFRRGGGSSSHDDTPVSEAGAVLHEARDQAASIVRETKFFSEQVKTDIDRTLKEVQQQIGTIAGEHAERLNTEMLAVLDEELKAFIEHVRAGREEADKQLTTIVRQEREAVRKEYKQWFKEHVAQTEERLVKAMPTLVRDVAGRTIPLEEHERLVHEALTQVAKDGWDA